jgi:signal peptidase I
MALSGKSRLRSARLFGRAVAWASFGFLASLVIAIGLCSLVGFRALTVLSGSMEPTIDTGDLVIGRWIAPAEARVGDVVTFREPGSRRLITHRVRSVRVVKGRVRVVTRGDANNASERWSVPADGRISRVGYRLPKAGYVKAWLGSRYGRLGLITIPALLLGILELARIWRPRRQVIHREPKTA